MNAMSSYDSPSQTRLRDTGNVFSEDKNEIALLVDYMLEAGR